MQFKNISFLSLIFLIVTIFSCVDSSKKTLNDTTYQLNDPLITNRDTTVNPSSNFFLYANGGWFKRNPIPSTDKSNGIFKTIDDTIQSQIKRVCEKSSKETNLEGSNKQKIGDFYLSGMDTVSIEKLGVSPLLPHIKKIEAITNINSLMSTVCYLHTLGTDPVFNFYVGQDDKNSTKYALGFSQGGLGLGQKDYYLLSDERTLHIRKEYFAHLIAMFKLIGQTELASTKSAQSVMEIETELATSSRSLEALRDPMSNYNKMSVAGFNKLTPLVKWEELLTVLGLKNVDTVIVGQPEFFKGLNKLVKKYSLEDWKAYLKWDLVNSFASYLTKSIQVQNFKFYSTVMLGVAQEKPRWKQVVEQTNRTLGELIGQVYVAEYLPKGSKEKLLEIGNNIRDVYSEHLKNLDWMSETTKKKALFKLASIVMKVGYPDVWRDMSSVKINKNFYFENVLKGEMWMYTYSISKFGKTVDRSEWKMFPQTYNAYYEPANNEIVVPACNIIVPGFEGRMPDDAILYGIIGGSTFGHEITHGFDDTGSQYDANGNLNNWWTGEDKKKFLSKTKLIVDQFSKFKVLDSIHVNGEATQGENIADLGGVVMGYEAFKKTLQFKNNQIISGLSPDQRFFLSYAYAWMVNIKKEALSRQILIDVHAPAQFRINGPLSNLKEFYKTFNVKPGDGMYQLDSLRVLIW